MAARGDIGHNETEYLLKRMELRISKEYAKAAVEIEDKLKDYMRRFAIKDELKQKGVAAGILTEQEYKNWRIGQIAIGKRWEEMKNTIAQDLTNAAKIAGSITNSYMPDVYAVNHNYGTFQVEKLSGMDTSYTLYDRQTVERMFRDEEKFYHAPGKKVSRAIAEGKQLAWDKKLVQSVMTQSLLQGESVGGIATRLAQAVGDRDRKACIRNARTMATGVQNAGRVDSYKRAENMGIELQQEWLATIDGRTRHEHRLLDGQRVKVGEKFKVEGYELEYPADPNGEPEMVYNCRCTLIPALKGHEVDTSNISLRNTDHALEKEYQEWKKSRNIHSDPITKQDEIAARMRAIYGAEYARYAIYDSESGGYGDSELNNINNNGNINNIITSVNRPKGEQEVLKQFDVYDLNAKTEAEKIAQVNPHFEEGEEWNNNCQRCVVADELICRGYDVTAKPYSATDSIKNSGFAAWDFDKDNWFNDKGFSFISLSDFKEDVKKSLNKWGDKARAFVRVELEDKGGHFITVKQTEKGVYFVDSQINSVVDIDSMLQKCLPLDYKYWIMRTDNRKVTDAVVDAVQNLRGE